jgi:hypothetical protein
MTQRENKISANNLKYEQMNSSCILRSCRQIENNRDGSTNWIATIRDLFKKKIPTKNARMEVSIIGNSKRISETNGISWRCNLAEAQIQFEYTTGKKLWKRGMSK